MHGRLGPAVLQHLARRQDPALPRRREHHRARIRIGALQSFDRLDLAEFRGLQPLSRHRLDAGAVQELRVQGNRFRRLPLPGLCADRRCRQYRSGLHAVADARADLQAGRARGRRATRTASSIAISPAARWRRTATMAPDADAGKSAQTRRSVCAADLGAARRRRRPRDLCRKRRPRRRHSRGLSAWRARQRLPARPSPAVRSRALPRRAVRPARRRPQPPQGPPRRQYAAASDRGHGSDPREIRLRALDGRRRLLGRDAGAGLCAGASRPRHRHRAARDLSRHAAAKSKADFSTRCRASIPASSDDFLERAAGGANARSRSRPISAAFSIPIPTCTARPRGPGTTPNAFFPSTRRTATRLDLDGADLIAAPCRRRRSWKRIISPTTASCSRTSLLREAGRLEGIPGIIVQGRYDLLCPPATSHALAARWRDAEIRIVEGAGHTLYDPGVRDAVMKAIADMASRISQIRNIENADRRKRHAADVDGHRRRGRSRIQPLVRPRTSRGARRDRRLPRSPALCRPSTATRNISASIPPKRSRCSTARPIAPRWRTRPTGRRRISRASRT